MRGQRLAVLNELKAGNEVTSMTMWHKYGITRLSGIIYDLKSMGYTIHTVMKEGKTRFGETTKYASYILGVEREEE
jgi:hypothetical protein